MSAGAELCRAWWIASLACVVGCAFDESGVQVAGLPPIDGGSDQLIVPDAPPPLDSGPDLTIAPLPEGGVAADGSGCLNRQCKDGQTICEGPEGGVVIGEQCPLGCNTTGDDCAAYAPAHVPAELLRSASGHWIVSKRTSLDTTTTKVQVDGQPASFPAGVTYYNPEAFFVIALGRLEVKSGATLVVRGKRPLVILAGDRILIEGEIDCSGDGPYPGPGGAAGGSGGSAGGGCGGGPPGEDQDLPFVPPFTGAAGGSFGGRGGAGGGGPSGGPSGLATCGTSNLDPLLGGSGGGGGVSGVQGGGGGGALQLSAWAMVHVEGKINCGGGGGGGAFGGVSSGGGGGSGGSILLEAPAVVIEGVVAANGGGGGGGAYFGWGGEAGQDARVATTPAEGGDGGDGLLGDGAVGGDGSGGAQTQGMPGEDKESGGGGGGGAGRILVRNIAGAVSGGGVVSPDRPALVTETIKALP